MRLPGLAGRDTFAATFVNIKIQNTMKLIEIISLAAVAVFASSCEKTENQNQEPETVLSEAVAGTYTGYSTAEFRHGRGGRNSLRKLYFRYLGHILPVRSGGYGK